MASQSKPPSAFISYSHDSKDHEARVLNFSDRLRRDGVEAILDQYEPFPREGWIRWMERQIRDADYVLMICTETYCRRADGKEDLNKGLGVIDESQLIQQHLYDSGGMNDRFIPVLLNADDRAYIPIRWRRYNHYNIDTEEGYESLYRLITNQPHTVKSQLGKLRTLPPRERKLDFLNAAWNVPYSRNVFFTGRDQFLKKLHADLSEVGTAPLAQAISGLGGIGKTQTAVEYAYRHREEYSAVLWARADTAESLTSSFEEIAGLLKLSEGNKFDPKKTIDEVKNWLERNADWLLIFDNPDRPETVLPFLPNYWKGSVLLTSRAQVFSSIGVTSPIELEEMTLDESLQFLLRRTGRDESNERETKAAEELIKELGCLPLALEQAGAYILANKTSFQDYLKSYRDRLLRLLNEHGPITGNYPESVRTTWAMNVRQVDKFPDASDLLRITAFLKPDSIPLRLLIEGALEFGPNLSATLAQAYNDPVIINEALEPLTRYSLIRRDFASNTYSVHRLVQAVVRDVMQVETQRLWAERVVRAINRAWKVVRDQLGSDAALIRQQAFACVEMITAWDMNFIEAGELLHNISTDLIILHPKSGDGESALLRALKIRKEHLGLEHTEVASTINSLGELYYEQKRFADAESLFRQALSILERSSNPSAPEVATAAHNLATLYIDLKKYHEAEALFQRALSIREKVLGSNDPIVASTLNDLAQLYLELGKVKEAENLLEKSKSLREAVLEVDDFELSTANMKLAEIRESQGRHSEAAHLLASALETKLKNLNFGPEDISSFFWDQAQRHIEFHSFVQAEVFFTYSLSSLEKAVGFDDPKLIPLLNAFADFCGSQGKILEEEALYRRALEIAENTLKPQDLYLVTSLHDLAACYSKQGRFDEAEPLFSRALEQMEKSPDTDVNRMAIVLENYASLLRFTGRKAEAQEMKSRARAMPGKSAGGLWKTIALVILFAGIICYIAVLVVPKLTLMVEPEELQPSATPGKAVPAREKQPEVMLNKSISTKEKQPESTPYSSKSFASDESYLQYGHLYRAEEPQNFDRKNPHQVAQYSVFICKEGRSDYLVDRLMHVEEDESLGQEFMTYVREFGPDLERFKGQPLYLKFEGLAERDTTSVWYYYLVDSNGVNLPGGSWISLHRSKDSGNCALTGIFLNSPDEEGSEMPGGLRRSR